MNLLEAASFVLRSVVPGAVLVAALPAGIWIFSGADRPIKWWVFVVPALVGIAILLFTDGWDLFAAWWGQDSYDRAWPVTQLDPEIETKWFQLKLRAIGLAIGYVVGVVALLLYSAD